MTDSFFNHGETGGDKPGPDNLPHLDDDFGEGRPSEERRMMAVMAYIPFLCFIPIIKMRDDAYVYFHARQGLILFFAEIIAFIFTFPHLSQLFWTVVLIACIGAAVAGIMFALQGKMHRIPLIGDIAEKFKM